MDSIKKLTELFTKFPTVGPRTAGRFVYYLIKQPKEKIDELTNAIQEIKNKIKLCQFCFDPFEIGGSPTAPELCPICSDPRRDKNLLCIVEKEMDLDAIEKTKRYNGLYFILGGTVGTMKTEEINNLRLEELKSRVMGKNHAPLETRSLMGFSEIIVALNPTQEGKATSILVERALKEINYSGKITHLAKGIPVGGELEYADEETLESAFDGRK